MSVDKRMNIYIQPETREKLEKLSDEDRRSTSNFIDWLVNKEWDDRYPTELPEPEYFGGGNG